MEKINEKNFFLSTRGNFKMVQRPRRNPDYISLDKFGEVSSEYWYTPNGVIRDSNHWSHIYSEIFQGYRTSLRVCKRVASCYWTLEQTSDLFSTAGFCEWNRLKYNDVFSHHHKK